MWVVSEKWDCVHQYYGKIIYIYICCVVTGKLVRQCIHVTDTLTNIYWDCKIDICCWPLVVCRRMCIWTVRRAYVKQISTRNTWMKEACGLYGHDRWRRWKCNSCNEADVCRSIHDTNKLANVYLDGKMRTLGTWMVWKWTTLVYFVHEADTHKPCMKKIHTNHVDVNDKRESRELYGNDKWCVWKYNLYMKQMCVGISSRTQGIHKLFATQTPTIKAMTTRITQISRICDNLNWLHHMTTNWYKRRGVEESEMGRWIRVIAVQPHHASGYWNACILHEIDIGSVR